MVVMVEEEMVLANAQGQNGTFSTGGGGGGSAYGLPGPVGPSRGGGGGSGIVVVKISNSIRTTQELQKHLVVLLVSMVVKLFMPSQALEILLHQDHSVKL